MGNIYEFDLQPWVDAFELENYVETGLGWNESLRHALKYNFRNFYSVDLDQEMIDKAAHLLQKHDNLTIIHDYSTNFLKTLVPELIGGTLFFLDAHVAMADKHAISYEESLRTYKEHALPLVEEIKIIKENRDISNDVFVLDDWMIVDPDLDYESYKHGVRWNCGELQKELGLAMDKKEIFNLFPDHKIEIDTRSQGYFVATPKWQGYLNV